MENYIQFAKDLAFESSSIIMSYYKTNLSIIEKKDTSPVTAADQESEKKMRKMIIDKFPDHGIIGEEFGSLNQDSEFTWVLDPIDGTKSFIHGVPIFGTLIALLQNNKPIMGVINHPVLNEMVIGVKDRKTTINDQPVQVSNQKQLSKATMLCTDMLDVINHQNFEKFINLSKQVKLFRGWGDCYMYTLLAKGSIEIAIDPVMNYWDIQALIPIIKGAGGTVSDYQGQKPEKATSLIASTPALHENIIQLLN